MNSNSLATYLSAEEIGAVQLGVMQLLSEEILQYTNYQSSSVRTETAQNILESMLYSITAYLDTQSDPAAVLRTQQLKELRRKGLNLLKQYVEECRVLLKEVKATRTPTELIAYNNTIDDAFDEFFKSYDPQFDAQNTAAMIDYPLLKDDQSVTGIVYIKNYLTQLKSENVFCAGYSKNYIRSLLLTHGLKHHLDYREMLINIPELILENNKPGV